MRRGFSLIIAIIFLVLVATIGMFSLNTSAVTAKQTTDIFLREQAELLAQSATEVAILNLLQRNFSTDCPITAGNEIIVNQPFPDAANTLFNVTVRVDRLFGTIGTCVGSAISTPGSVGTVILDTVVQSATPIPVRVHRRTIQKL